MPVPEIIDRYFAAWNAHDAAAIVSTFAPDGTYEDSGTRAQLRGDAIGANAAQLWSALPDVHFEIVSEDSVPGGVAAQWIMRGTNRGSFNGLPPTGKPVVLPGADFIKVGPDGIESVRGYFDAYDLPRQLGLQVIVQPASVGPFSFGTSVRVGGSSTAKPGAVSITMLRARDAADVERVRELSRQIAQELPGKNGFLGFIAATIGDRMVTLTAWQDAANPREMMKEGTHKGAMPAFFKEISAGGWTSAWIPDRVNAYWVRCTACGQMEDSATKTTCRCGATLPERATYW